MDFLIKLYEIFQQAQQYSHEHKTDLDHQMYEKRFKYLGGSLLYIIVILFFIVLGTYSKEYFFFPAYFYLWMGVCIVMLAFGILTFFNYLWIIIKRSKNEK